MVYDFTKVMKVKANDENLHRNYSVCFPARGTEGVVLAYDSTDRTVRVQWPEGTTSGNDIWWCFESSVVEVIE